MQFYVENKIGSLALFQGKVSQCEIGSLRRILQENPGKVISAAELDATASSEEIIRL